MIGEGLTALTAEVVVRHVYTMSTLSTQTQKLGRTSGSGIKDHSQDQGPGSAALGNQFVFVNAPELRTEERAERLN